MNKAGQKEERKSALAQAIEGRERKLYEFDAGDILGASGTPLGKYKVRVATKAEADRAVVAAHQYVQKVAGGTAAAADPDLLTDAKTVHILHTVCRDADMPMFCAFPSPEWMRNELTTDELAVLLNSYNEVVRMSGPGESDLSEERVEALAEACVKFASTDAPNIALMQCSREYLAELCVRLALNLAEAREPAINPPA